MQLQKTGIARNPNFLTCTHIPIRQAPSPVTPILCATDDVINNTDVDGTREEFNSFVGYRLLNELQESNMAGWERKQTDTDKGIVVCAQKLKASQKKLRNSSSVLILV